MYYLSDARWLLFCCLLFTAICCTNSATTNDGDAARRRINDIGLKRGDLINCGPPEKEFGIVSFSTSCRPETKKDFELGIALLHSFEYDEAEKAFSKVIDQDPDCAIAYWGVAMSNYHPLWAPPTQKELEKGAKAIAMARSLMDNSEKKTGYIEALAAFYRDYATTNHKSRSFRYKEAMEKLHVADPSNKELTIFYALSLIATADLADKTFGNQKKAGDLLNSLYPQGPNHPGIIHYIIHAYDYPELATLALPAARRYASIAPSSAHAQHMPSHIFTRLGLWDEDIQSNLAAVSSARCYAEAAGIKGHWDEELHAIDYLVYSYLQKGDNVSAKEQVDYLVGMNNVSPKNFKVFYAFAASPSRYLLENKMWKDAASLAMLPVDYKWDQFPWQKAIIHFTRVLGAANTSAVLKAKEELKNLEISYDTLIARKDDYHASQVMTQIKSGGAWIAFKEGRNSEAIEIMKEAADLEDKAEKEPVTPSEVLPARQLLADMLLEMNKPAEALQQYEADLKKHPNRFNSLYGVARCSEKTGDKAAASKYYQQLISVANGSSSNRDELKMAKLFLEKHPGKDAASGF